MKHQALFSLIDKSKKKIVLFLIETIYCYPHLNRGVKTVQMSGYITCFYAELTKIIPNYHQILPLV